MGWSCDLCGFYNPDDASSCGSLFACLGVNPRPPQPSVEVATTMAGLDMGRVLRDEAITRVDVNSTEFFKAHAPEVIRFVASMHQRFSTDDFWEEWRRRNYPSAHDNRAIGPQMMRAERRRWIHGTDVMVESRLPWRHARPVRVYDSLIFGGTP